MSVLDAYLPAYDQHEVHERTIAAPPAEVWRAMHEVAFTDLTLTRPLMGLRMLPAWLSRRTKPSARAEHRSFLEAFYARGWCLLGAEEAVSFAAGGISQPWHARGGKAVPLSTPEEFAAFTEPDYVRMVMSFELTPDGDGTRLRTETRVQATDPRSARVFARYWLLIRQPSGLIRRDLLRAIGRLAERVRAQAPA